ncbi:Defensin SD2 [Carex littledalei]|uniref:Defensin SD2 n=1 Tax=Carex littledalei TaxID=544730 RepID=A0A833R1S0_9POAL|nr:Defensin SD2 [Carex littledalei]
MENAQRLFPAFVLLLLLLASSVTIPSIALETEMGVPSVEARICETPSAKFKHICMSSANCASICGSEGFVGGKCQGARMRILTVKFINMHLYMRLISFEIHNRTKMLLLQLDT